MKAWITRNADGSLLLFNDNAPQKGHLYWFNFGNYGNITIEEQYLPEGCNPQWSDEEPTEVELTIKKI